MKKILLGFLFAAGLQITASAQDAPGPQMRTPEERAQRQTEMLSQKLSLTEEQRNKIYEVNMKTAKQMQKFREAHDTANVRMIRTASDGAYQKILTAEQYQQYEELKKQRMERRGGWKNREEHNEGRDN